MSAEVSSLKFRRKSWVESVPPLYSPLLSKWNPANRHLDCKSSAFFVLASAAVEVGVPNLETDLFTIVNQLCPNCNTLSNQAWKLLGEYKCTQANVQFVYVLCTSLGTCTLELLLGHSWYLHWHCLGTTCSQPYKQSWLANHRVWVESQTTKELYIVHLHSCHF